MRRSGKPLDLEMPTDRSALTAVGDMLGGIEFINLGSEMSNRLFGALLRSSPVSNSPDAVVSPYLMEATVSVSSEVVESCAREAGLDTLPNDLTRMLYLASLRDCNSGRYLHPQISHRLGVEGADRALCACHEDVFSRLLTTPVWDYVLQLEEYMRYTRAERSTFLRTWQSLQAYRATVPLRAHPISSELFCLNIEAALTILKNTGPPLDT